MLQVADLQRLMSGLVDPMRSAGASQKVLDDVARLAQGLEPFKEHTLADFNDFLQKAQQCVQSGEWPAPGKRAGSRRGEANGPRLSVEEATQRLASLAERAATDGSLDDAAIDAEMQALEPMSGTQLKEAAEQIHITARGRTKADLLRMIADAIKERRSSAGRSHGEPRPEQHASHGHGHAQPAAAGQPGHR